MPFKIEVHTNINDYELTLEKCNEIISVLQETYENVRKELYSQFLSMRSLKKALIFVLVLFGLYMLTESLFLIYLMPISVIFSLLSSIVSAEYLTSQTRKQIEIQLQHYKQKYEMLRKEEQFKV